MKLEDVPTPETDELFKDVSKQKEYKLLVGGAFLYQSKSLERRLGLAVAALQQVDSKIGHFAKAPHDDELAVVSLIGYLARNVKETLAQIEKGTK